jgi:cytochrome c5
VRIPNKHFSRNSALITGLIWILGLGILAAPSKSATPSLVAPRAALPGTRLHEVHSLTVAVPRPTAAQDAGQTPPATAPPPAAAKPVELPEGDGKPIATEYCQMCHKLTNLTKAHKNLDEWKDTIHTMIDRGASIPDDKVDVLAQYLAANFGPKDANAPANAPAATPGTPAPAPNSAAPPAPAPAKPAVELPDGDGKAIATENCQACHKLTNLTKAHKSLDDWKETVQTMIDRGANVPADQVDTLVQYLAKNFGPKDASAPAPAAPPSPNPAQ